MSEKSFDSRLSTVEANIKILEKIEEKVDSIYKKLYENGMSADVAANTKFRKSFSKLFWIGVTAIAGQVITIVVLVQKIVE